MTDNATKDYLTALASFHTGNKHAQFVLDHAREALSGPLGVPKLVGSPGTELEFAL